MTGGNLVLRYFRSVGMLGGTRAGAGAEKSDDLVAQSVIAGVGGFFDELMAQGMRLIQGEAQGQQQKDTAKARIIEMSRPTIARCLNEESRIDEKFHDLVVTEYHIAMDVAADTPNQHFVPFHGGNFVWPLLDRWGLRIDQSELETMFAELLERKVLSWVV